MKQLDSNYISIENPNRLFKEKIENYRNTPSGWYFGQGVPPNDQTIDNALEIALYAYNNFFDIDSTIGISGEIQLIIYRKLDLKRYIEITLESDDRTFNVTKYQYVDDGWEITDEKDVNDKLNLKTDIEKFSREFHLLQCHNTLESSPNETSSSILKDTAALPSKITTAEYQLFELAA